MDPCNRHTQNHASQSHYAIELYVSAYIDKITHNQPAVVGIVVEGIVIVYVANTRYIKLRRVCSILLSIDHFILHHIRG